jgi:hypothetical protein
MLTRGRGNFVTPQHARDFFHPFGRVEHFNMRHHIFAAPALSDAQMLRTPRCHLWQMGDNQYLSRKPHFCQTPAQK